LDAWGLSTPTLLKVILRKNVYFHPIQYIFFLKNTTTSYHYTRIGPEMGIMSKGFFYGVFMNERELYKTFNETTLSLFEFYLKEKLEKNYENLYFEIFIFEDFKGTD
jgi:hypothetical protein